MNPKCKTARAFTQKGTIQKKSRSKSSFFQQKKNRPECIVYPCTFTGSFESEKASVWKPAFRRSDEDSAGSIFLTLYRRRPGWCRGVVNEFGAGLLPCRLGFGSALLDAWDVLCSSWPLLWCVHSRWLILSLWTKMDLGRQAPSVCYVNAVARFSFHSCDLLWTRYAYTGLTSLTAEKSKVLPRLSRRLIFSNTCY